MVGEGDSTFCGRRCSDARLVDEKVRVLLGLELLDEAARGTTGRGDAIDKNVVPASAPVYGDERRRTPPLRFIGLGWDHLKRYSFQLVRVVLLAQHFPPIGKRKHTNGNSCSPVGRESRGNDIFPLKRL